MSWEQAIEALFRAPHATFVAERKRLAAELKLAGHRDDAAKLMKLGRPPASAWAVNQTYWRARDEFNAFLETARRIRAGDIKALPDHKAAIATLRQHAETFLKESGNAAQDTTLRRVEITLSAIAATGTFDPDPAGALSEDRDPPGFLSLGIAGGPVEAPPPSAPLAPVLQLPQRPQAEPAPQGPTEEEVRAAAVKERERREAEQRVREERAAERAAAQEQVTAAELAVAKLELELASARKQLVMARTKVADLERDS